jgi:hypothetical protein
MLIRDSGTVVDLKGRTLKDNILVQGPVKDVVIQNGTLRGEIRFRASDYKKVLEEYNKTKHWTREVRKVAPQGAVLRDLVIEPSGDTHSLYCGPGTTGVRVVACEFKGESKGPLIYLSMEGAYHEVLRCEFRGKTGMRREIIAIDGCAESVIRGCKFLRCTQGGIYIYRNSGENGTIRHQEPRFNLIKDNRFDLRGMWLRSSFLDSEVPHGVIVGSRQGSRTRHNDLDAGYPWGSSKDDRDFARQNTVIGNRFKGDWFKRWVCDNDKNNTVVDNKAW